MRNKKTAPTTKQNKLHKAMRELGCVVTGVRDVQLHHCVGSSAKHNKIWIGQDFVIPLCWKLHDVHSTHPLNITHHKKAFEEAYGTEFALWEKALGRIGDGFVDQSVFNAIADLCIVHDDTTSDWLDKL